MKKLKWLFIFIVIAVAIVSAQYYLNYKYFTEVPTKTWSKEIKVNNCSHDIINGIRIVKYKGINVLAVDDGTNIKIFTLDNKGKKLKEKVFNTKSDFLYSLNLLTDGKRIYFDWITDNQDVRKLHTIVIDDNFNIISQHVDNGIKEAATIGNDKLLLTYADKIVVRDISTGKEAAAKVEGASYTSGTKTDKGDLIAFLIDSKHVINYFYYNYNNGNVTPVKLAGKYIAPKDAGIVQTVLGADKNHGYLLINLKVQVQNQVQKFCFNLNKLEYNTDSVVLEDTSANCPVSISSGDSARFAMVSLRNNGKMNGLFNIADLYIKDNQIQKYEFINNKDRVSNYMYVCGDLIAYCDFVQQGDYNIYIQSQNEAFKKVHNVVRQSEINDAISQTSYEMISSIFSIINFGVIWWLPGLALIGIVFFISGTYTDKKRKIALTIAYILMSLIKIYNINQKLYVNPSLIPTDILGRPVGFAIMAVTSALCCFYAYRTYSTHKGDMPFVTFIYALVIDTLFTQMIFVPFFIS